MSDHEIIAAVLRGDVRAERELYDTHVDRVFRLAYRMAGDETLARDFTQDTFIRAFDRLSDFRGDSSLATWLHTIAVSVILNGLKKVRRIHGREIGGDELPEVSITRRESEPDLKHRMRTAIDALPDGYRTVFVMHDVEGFTHEEIGTALGIQPGTSKAQLFRARAKLRTALAEFAGGVGLMTHDDDKFEAFLEREARGYNAPPAAVPRDVMWERIAKARATPARRPMRYAPWMGMAATLLIGVGIGRYAMQRETPVQQTASAPLATASLAAAPLSAAPPAMSIEPAATDPVSARVTTSTRAPRGEAVRYAPSRRSQNSGTYSVASQQHLTRAEALVAVVAAMPRDAMMDSLTARWAKDVLTNTRLLLDSPAGDDPVRRRLLEDLETVLVQLVQRSGRAAEDRDMLDRTLEKTQLLTRLRSGAIGT